MVKKSAAAGTGAAGTGAATTAATNRIGGGDGESGAITGFNKIYLDGATGTQQVLFDQKGEVVFFKSSVVLFWLIQSQSQRWACSAALHEGDANGGIDIVLREICF